MNPEDGMIALLRRHTAEAYAKSGQKPPAERDMVFGTTPEEDKIISLLQRHTIEQYYKQSILNTRTDISQIVGIHPRDTTRFMGLDGRKYTVRGVSTTNNSNDYNAVFGITLLQDQRISCFFGQPKDRIAWPRINTMAESGPIVRITIQNTLGTYSDVIYFIFPKCIACYNLVVGKVNVLSPFDNRDMQLISQGIVLAAQNQDISLLPHPYQCV
jgi:hypothetical protein